MDDDVSKAAKRLLKSLEPKKPRKKSDAKAEKPKPADAGCGAFLLILATSMVVYGVFGFPFFRVMAAGLGLAFIAGCVMGYMQREENKRGAELQQGHADGPPDS